MFRNGIFVLILIFLVCFLLGWLYCRKTNKKIHVMTILLCLLGLFALGTGVYLFPATSWRTISYAAIAVGICCELIGIFVTLKN